MKHRLLTVLLVSLFWLLPLRVCGQTGYELGGQAGAASRLGFAARGMASGNALSAVAQGDCLS